MKSTCTQAAEAILGNKCNNKKCENKHIKELSQKQKKLGKDINACINKTTRDEMRKERNKTLKEIHTIIAQEEAQKIMDTVEDIEKIQR